MEVCVEKPLLSTVGCAVDGAGTPTLLSTELETAHTLLVLSGLVRVVVESWHCCGMG